MKKTPRKPIPVFELQFDGKNVLPEDIPLGTLTTTLSSIRRLASGAELSDEELLDDSQADDSSQSIHLLDVKRGSAIYRFVCPETISAINNLRDVGKILHNPEDVSGKEYVLNPIEQLSVAAHE